MSYLDIKSFEQESKELYELLREVCNSWVNGRKVIDGIPQELRRRIEKDYPLQ